MKIRLLAILAAMTLACALFPGSALAQEIIDFEDLSPETSVFDQYPGVRFPGIGHIVTPAFVTSSGLQALSSKEPGEEFNSGPLSIDFESPQQFVRLKAGIEGSSDLLVEATLRGFDASGNLVDEVGPLALPAPSPITTEMSVETDTAEITRVELRYSRAFAETIDDLQFSTAPAGTVDTEPPVVEIIQPADNGTLTGEQFLIASDITEDGALSSVEITIFHQPSDTTVTFPVSSFGVSPNFHFGPVFTGPLGMGRSLISVRATDFSGNTGSDTVRVERVAIAGELRIDDDVIVIPRWPGAVDPLTVRLEETFPGSLDGREDIVVNVPSLDGINEVGHIRDRLNDPLPETELTLHAQTSLPLGLHTATLEAREQGTDQILDTATVLASIVPASAVDCLSNVPVYSTIDPEEFSAQLTESTQRTLDGEGSIVFGGDDNNSPDPDVGLPLTELPSQVSFVDQASAANPDGNDTLDVGEAVYLDNDSSGEVSVGDERLKNAVNGANGSIVASDDGDVGAELSPLPANVRYWDMSEDGTLNALLRETVVIDADDSETITAGDIRIVDSHVQQPLDLIGPMTVTYLNDPFGAGELRVEARFLSNMLGFFGGEFHFIGDMRIGFRPGTNVFFTYTYTYARASGTLLSVPVIGGLIASEAEDRFRAGFLDQFRISLGQNITQQLQNRRVLLFFQTAYVNRDEFALGFCIPAAVIRNEFGG